MPNKSGIHLKTYFLKRSFLNDILTPIRNGIFQKEESYNSLRNQKTLFSKRKITTTYGINTIAFRILQIFQDFPLDLEILII